MVLVAWAKSSCVRGSVAGSVAVSLSLLLELSYFVL